MEIYLVGGAVRDRLLGREPKDRDYVVVGATQDEMVAIGFRQIDAAFPVFYDSARNQYALARRERRNPAAEGHRAFAVEFDLAVTLEEDLGRRDLTINAMAQAEDGRIIDPYGGQEDLKRRLLCHINSEAFAEDPLRVLRVARFAAQLDFEVAEETRYLLWAMVARGMLRTLTPERVFEEINRALLSPRPSRFFRLLLEVGALHQVLPELDALVTVPENTEHHPEGTSFEHVMLVLDEVAAQSHVEAFFDEAGLSTAGRLHVAWAALCHDLGKAHTPVQLRPKHPGHELASADLARTVLTRLRAPGLLMDTSVVFSREHMRAKLWRQMRPGKVLRLLDAIGALRHSSRLPAFLALLRADLMGRKCPFPEHTYNRMRWEASRDQEDLETRWFWTQALAAALTLQGADILADPAFAGKTPGRWVGEVLMQRRIRAIQRVPKVPK